MLSVNKLFSPYSGEINDAKIVFKTEFYKLSNHKPVTLLLTSDDMIYKINVAINLYKKTKRYCMCLTYEVRFSVRTEPANQQPVKQMRGDEFHSQIYKLSFERDDTNHVELYCFNFTTMYWFDYLRVRLHMLDYQLYYEVSKLIGKGTFASVYEAKSKNDGVVYAAKAFQKKLAFQDPKGREQIENEIRIMRLLNHPNLCNLHEVFENKAQIYLILDLARGGTLEYSLKVLNGPVPFLPAKVIFKQIVEAVHHMHQKGIMHRDLKPGNILFKEFIPLKKYGLINTGPNVLVSDLGIASEIGPELKVYQYCGSPGYMAPEVFETEGNPQKTYTEKCDIFSLGCILYQLLSGKMLFQVPLKQSNIEMKLNFQAIEQELHGSHTLTTLLQKMLSPDPNERPSTKDLLEAKILEVEYGQDGIPLYKDFQRPKSSPPKRLIAEQKPQAQKTPLTSKAIKVMPILEEKRERKNSDKEREITRNQKRNTHNEQQISALKEQVDKLHQQEKIANQFTPQTAKNMRRSSAIVFTSQQMGKK